VCLHPGARDPAKRWPVEHFARLGDALHGAGLEVVLTGSGDERALTATLARAMRAPTINCAAPVSIGAIAALLSRARLLVSNDTGVSHVAAALRLPSVVVFMSTDPRRWAPLDANRHRVVHDPAGIGLRRVLRTALRLVAETSTPDESQAAAPAIRQVMAHRRC
jgi:ADP-heptose:LPS heptosyltransferase